MQEVKNRTLSYARHIGRELALLTLSALMNNYTEDELESVRLEDLLERSVRVLVSEAETQFKESGQVFETAFEDLKQLDLDTSEVPAHARDLKLYKKQIQDEFTKIRQRLLEHLEELEQSLNSLEHALHIPLLNTLQAMPHVREFALTLVETYRKHAETINSYVDKVSPEWPVKRMFSVDRDLVRLAAAEMFYDPSARVLHSDSTPLPVVINEAVELAKKYGSQDSYRFVNGVLREILPQAESLRSQT